MSILNITPDSFSDGGTFYTDELQLDRVLRYAEGSISAGSSILDVGGESSRPGASAISVTEELDRVIPVIEALRARFDTLISVDSSTPEVIRESAAAGVRLINDIRSLQRRGAMEAALETGLPVCLVHMQGTPKTMQKRPTYANVVRDVHTWLMRRVDACLVAGFSANQLVLDPGFGFGKTLDHNIALFRDLARLVQTGYPVLVGVSRKTMIGEITGRPIEQRITGSAMAAAIAASYGAAILRVHDVAETRDALIVMQALTQGVQ